MLYFAGYVMFMDQRTHTPLGKFKQTVRMRESDGRPHRDFDEVIARLKAWFVGYWGGITSHLMLQESKDGKTTACI